MGEERLSLLMECTMYFQEHGSRAQTLSTISERLGYPPDVLQPVLHHLVALSILEEIHRGGHTVYQYKQPQISA